MAPGPASVVSSAGVEGFCLNSLLYRFVDIVVQAARVGGSRIDGTSFSESAAVNQCKTGHIETGERDVKIWPGGGRLTGTLTV